MGSRPTLVRYQLYHLVCHHALVAPYAIIAFLTTSRTRIDVFVRIVHRATT